MTDVRPYWKALKEEPFASSFPAMETWLTQHAVENQAAARPPAHFFLTVRQALEGRRFRRVYAMTFLLMLVGACSIPFEHEATLGYELTWDIRLADLMDTDVPTRSLETQFPWIAQGTLEATVDPTTRLALHLRFMATDVSATHAVTWKEALEQAGYPSNIQLEPVRQSVKESTFTRVARALGMADPTERIARPAEITPPYPEYLEDYRRIPTWSRRVIDGDAVWYEFDEQKNAIVLVIEIAGDRQVISKVERLEETPAFSGGVIFRGLTSEQAALVKRYHELRASESPLPSYAKSPPIQTRLDSLGLYEVILPAR